MKKISDIFWLAFGLVCIVYLVFLVGKRFLTDHISEKNIRYTKAVIIDHKNYNHNGREYAEYTYSYSFIANGKTYTGDSQDHNVKIGDTIEVQYDKDHPALNKPSHNNE